MVHMVPGNPGKSWNFILAFSRTINAGPGKSWKSISSCKKRFSFKKNCPTIILAFCYLKVYCSIIGHLADLEKSIRVLETSWKSPGKLFLKKGTNPVDLLAALMWENFVSELWE